MSRYGPIVVQSLINCVLTIVACWYLTQYIRESFVVIQDTIGVFSESVIEFKKVNALYYGLITEQRQMLVENNRLIKETKAQIKADYKAQR